MPDAKLKQRLLAEAKALGFDSMGIVQPDRDNKSEAAAANHLREFIDLDRHGTMDWMRETLERRSKPANLWDNVRSIIMVSMNYGPETNPLPELEHLDQGVVSVYARHRDYHDVMKGRLKTLASKLVAAAKPSDADVKVFVDTAPVMEKPLAARAGLGWQGKHTNLVSREFGSWLFLGCLFTTLDLPADDPEQDHCGRCRSCLAICPTDAFPAPYQLDARKCISYLTIEHAGPIPERYRKAMGNRIYGCDDCLAVCPWNKFAKAASEAKLAAPPVAHSKKLVDFLALDDAAFRARFTGSPVKRIGRNRFIRNCLIAAGNSGDQGLKGPARRLTQDADPVVAEAAQWALKQLEAQ